jgi:tripartite-type tricarboxylate transporter receptor subunit TctC
MHAFDKDFSRRNFIRGSGLVLGSAALGSVPFRADAAAFPSRNIKVFVPTREGGGADRNLRAFTGVWKNYLKTNFEAAFYPGAAGRVGYETYMGKAPGDCYNLLFGNMGPEVLNWVVKKPSFPLSDYFYFARVDVDPSTVFVSAKSPFRTIDDVIAEGKKRTLIVGTSRLAHPASVGILAIGEYTGAKFNLIPLSGGKNTIAGIVTGEMDLGVLPSGSVAKKGTKVLRTLLVFDEKNRLGARLSSFGVNAPAANDHFGTKLPPLVSARAFAIKRKAVDAYPDRFKALNDSLTKVFGDPAYKKAVVKTKAPWENIRYGDAASCKAYVESITAIGERFKPLLKGKKG